MRDAVDKGANVNSLSTYGTTAIVRTIEATDIGGLEKENYPKMSQHGMKD